MSVTTLDVIIPSIGRPHFDEKLVLLRQNLATLTKCESVVVSVHCFLYSSGAEELARVVDVLVSAVPVERVVVHMEPGHLGSFMYRYIQPEFMRRYDYMMFLLDDIELPRDFDVASWIACYKLYDVDVLSPTMSLSSSSQTIMKKPAEVVSGQIRDVDFLEFFCYLMTPSVYAKYYTLLDENTRTLWGVDLLMHGRGLRMGIHNNVEMVHHYSRESTDELREAEQELAALILKHSDLIPVYSNQTHILSVRS